MNIRSKVALPLAAAFVAAAATAAHANDVSDMAREYKMPVQVVETVFRNVDNYFAAADGPGNRLASGLVKDISLKAVKNRMSSLEESGPGKASESSAEEKNAVYKAVIKTTRHETTETGECVDNRATISSSEGVPVVKDGAFSYDLTHPKVSSYSWNMTFCRTPLNGGTDFSEWQLAPAGN